MGKKSKNKSRTVIADPKQRAKRLHSSPDRRIKWQQTEEEKEIAGMNNADLKALVNYGAIAQIELSERSTQQTGMLTEIEVPNPVALVGAFKKLLIERNKLIADFNKLVSEYNSQIDMFNDFLESYRALVPAEALFGVLAKNEEEHKREVEADTEGERLFISYQAACLVEYRLVIRYGEDPTDREILSGGGLYSGTWQDFVENEKPKIDKILWHAVQSDEVRELEIPGVPNETVAWAFARLSTYWINPELHDRYQQKLGQLFDSVILPEVDLKTKWYRGGFEEPLSVDEIRREARERFGQRAQRTFKAKYPDIDPPPMKRGPAPKTNSD